MCLDVQKVGLLFTVTAGPKVQFPTIGNIKTNFALFSQSYSICSVNSVVMTERTVQ